MAGAGPVLLMRWSLSDGIRPDGRSRQGCGPRARWPGMGPRPGRAGELAGEQARDDGATWPRGRSLHGAADARLTSSTGSKEAVEDNCRTESCSNSTGTSVAVRWLGWPCLGEGCHRNGASPRRSACSDNGLSPSTGRDPHKTALGLADPMRNGGCPAASADAGNGRSRIMQEKPIARLTLEQPASYMPPVRPDNNRRLAAG